MKKLKTFTVGIFASLIALFMSCPRYDIITHFIGFVNNGANHGPQDIINNATDLPAYR